MYYLSKNELINDVWHEMSKESFETFTDLKKHLAKVKKRAIEDHGRKRVNSVLLSKLTRSDFYGLRSFRAIWVGFWTQDVWHDCEYTVRYEPTISILERFLLSEKQAIFNAT